jgi:hypothetical protein
VGRQNSESNATSTTLRGPPRKPKQSGYALWCGNLPAQTDIIQLKDHFSRDATDTIESVFLISKSNCAFINYKTEESCTAALTRFHDSRFHGTTLVCRLRRASTAPPAGTPIGPRTNVTPSASDQPAAGLDDHSVQSINLEDVAMNPTAVRMVAEKFFVLKSLTIEDLDASVRSASWATQSHNEAVLNAAHQVSIVDTQKAKAYMRQSARNVYLVFSANKSGEYYGYARMASGIDDTAAAETTPPRPVPSSTTPVDSSVRTPTPASEHAPKGYIIDDSARGTIFWEADRDENVEAKGIEIASPVTETAELDIEPQTLGRPFKIEWISTEKLPFHRARGLRNPWNQNREVKIARDGTEIEPSVGRRLVNLFHSSPQAVAAQSGGSQHIFPPVNPHMAPMGYPPDPRIGRPY